MKIKQPKYKFGNVMLIDDNELDNFINEKTLEANHFSAKVYVNTSAKSALEFLQNLVVMGKSTEALYPEVIFIDINMPMMDGFQFIDAFKKTLDKKIGSPRLVILTSSVYHEDKLKAEQLDRDILFLNKPLTKSMLENI